MKLKKLLKQIRKAENRRNSADTSCTKIKTWKNREPCQAFIGRADFYRPKQLFMPGDVYADRNGLAWTMQSDNGKYYRECGVIC